jgi:hypothetical protein
MIKSNFVIDISFNCENCEENITETIHLPEPNFLNYDDGGDDSSWEYINCNLCDHEHQLDIYCSFSSHIFSVSFNSNEISDGSPYYDESMFNELSWIIQNENSYKVFLRQLEIATEINESTQSNEDLQKSINIMNYAYIVAAIEGYIGTTFTHYILSHDAFFKKFIKSNKDFKDVKFTITELTDDPESIKKYVAEYLYKFIFHRIDKVKPLFKMVFDYDLKEIGWLSKAIQIRHDCVHRAGITQNNSLLDIDNTEIDDLIKHSIDFSRSLFSHLSELEKSLE